ncbi:class I SAM-dependent methyltransferase [Tessaracoccus oleiagri]|uniref:Methyltransferase domain-containing protein n=1 Tax=Tessaracoccus oleiagri TaxID=686624 RepID=A0A1G9M8U9_9ACTN|nr:class I SAM-dependent methyltransferase [Tessaracoccus oleiagri]SDL70676.1 Methyltransferase domain-containing protein [Tessaracoccus oleiagri]
MRTDYDSFAEDYNRENETSLLNAWYTRPAMLDLVGDVRGRHVLDIGCGAGPLAADLVERGARVSGFDSSPAMLEIARRRLGDRADLRVADLGEPLPYDDESFDVACAALVLHYLRDWEGPLAEIRRVLRPGGRLVAAVNHPLAYAMTEQKYFGIVQHELRHSFAGREASLFMWHRTLHDISSAVNAANLRIVSLHEPPVADDTPEELLPPSGVRRFISFLFLVLEREGATA